MDSYSSFGLMPPPSFSLFRRKHKRNNAEVKASSHSIHSSAASTAPSFSTRSSKKLSVSNPKPLLYNEEYYSFMESSVGGIKNDFVSGAREMANQALRSLGTLIELAAVTARDREELWKMGVGAAKQLGDARPSMRYVLLFGVEWERGVGLTVLQCGD
jgi:hypothetical protein